MIYHSMFSDDYLWYLILREKQKEKLKKNTIHPNTKFLLIFNGRSNKCQQIYIISSSSIPFHIALLTLVFLSELMSQILFFFLEDTSD